MSGVSGNSSLEGECQDTGLCHYEQSCHVIINGDSPLEFFEAFKQKLTRYLAKQGRAAILSKWSCGSPITITSEYQARNEIAYVIRNPYVARTDVNPLAYYWCSGFLYFNPFLSLIPSVSADSMSLRHKRDLSHSREGELPSGLTFIGDTVNPASFVDIPAVEKLFGSHRQFCTSVFRNIEAQIETAGRLGETATIPDEEILQIAFRLSREEFGEVRYADLTTDQRLALAKKLKYKYHSSNGQIARVIKLPLSMVNALFPLNAKTRQEGGSPPRKQA